MSTPRDQRTRRMPEHLRIKLAEALTRITNGPSTPLRDPTRGAEFNEGLNVGVDRCNGWRHSWVEHELRQVLAWADGAETSNDIRIYSAGLDYDK